MLRNLYYVMTIRGIPVRLHYTWIIVVLLGGWVLSGMTLPHYLPDLGTPALTALMILVLFFLTVVVHELAHLLAASFLNVRVDAINLYPLGALTRLPDLHAGARAALGVALAGPAASLALWWALNSIATAGIVSLWLAVVCFIVGQLSLYLALINLLPGLPLDGGRMLRAALWWLSSSFEQAHAVARFSGQIIAYGMIFLGAGMIVGQQNWERGGAFVLIGWAMREAAGAGYRRALIARLLNRLTAADVAQAPKRTVGPEATLRELAQQLHGSTGRQPTPVIANQMFLGIIDRDLLRVVPQGHWDTRTVAETMAPAAALAPLESTTPLAMVLPRLINDDRQEPAPLPVVQEGRLVGLIDPAEMTEFLDLEDEFGLVPRSLLDQPQHREAPGAKQGLGGQAAGASDQPRHAEQPGASAPATATLIEREANR